MTGDGAPREWSRGLQDFIEESGDDPLSSDDVKEWHRSKRKRVGGAAERDAGHDEGGAQAAGDRLPSR